MDDGGGWRVEEILRTKVWPRTWTPAPAIREAGVGEYNNNKKELCEALFRPVGRKISLTQPPTVDHVIGMEGSVVRATDVEEK